MPEQFTPVRIRIPRQSSSRREDTSNPYFEVERQSIKREDGTELSQVALVNKDNQRTLGIVGKNYKLTLHSEASNFVKGLLDNLGLEFASFKKNTSSYGARYHETIVLNSLKFNPATGLKSTALDNEGLNYDDVIPTLIVENSYNRTKPLSFNYGAYRVVCENGSAVPIKNSGYSVSFKHNAKINYDFIADNLKEGLNQVVNAIDQAYKTLNNSEGNSYLQALLSSSNFSDRFKIQVLEKLGAKVSVESVESVEDKKKFLTLHGVSTPVSAYAIYNVTTEIATHQIVSRVEQDNTSRQIAKLFEIAAA